MVEMRITPNMEEVMEAMIERLERYRSFTRDLFQLWDTKDQEDLEGGDIYALFEDHGFVTGKTATEEEAVRLSEFDVEPGDLISMWDPDLLPSGDLYRETGYGEDDE